MENKILHGDCLDLMREVPDKSVDMILADLPYGITACKWDSVIPFAPLWDAYKRIIKPNGAIVLTASQPFTSALVMSNPEMFKYEWIWEKSKASNFLLAKKQPLKSHENILVFGIGAVRYFPQKTEGLPFSRGKRKHDNGFITGAFNKVSNPEFSIENIDGFRNPRSVQYFTTAEIDGKFHPTQKPVELFRYLIRTYTNEGDLVLDNTAGSGTTAIACLHENRWFIVMEKELNYFETIKNRVKEFEKTQFNPQLSCGI